MSANDLLSPSLQASNASSIYSVGALFAAAFFGGSVAVCIMATLNAWRLARLGKDALWLVLALAGGVAILVVTLDQGGDNSTVRLLNRGAGFVLVGAFYLLYRRQYRSMTAMGINPPSPYLPVIAACILGFASTIVLVTLMAGNTGAGN